MVKDNPKYRLFQAVSKLSKNKEAPWNEVIKEWTMSRVDKIVGSQCLCGKENILEVNFFVNKFTGHTVKIGSNCVTKFIGTPLYILKGLQKIEIDPTASVPKKMIEDALQKKHIGPRESEFYLNVFRKRKDLTLSQAQWKQRINQKMKKKYTVEQSI